MEKKPLFGVIAKIYLYSGIEFYQNKPYFFFFQLILDVDGWSTINYYYFFFLFIKFIISE